MSRTSRIATAALLAVFVATAATADDAYVQVRATQVREKPKIWAKSIQQVNYGDRLTSLSAEGGWVRIETTRGGDGYLPESAVTSKKVVRGRQTVGEVRSDDIVLAGKGFNREVEKALRTDDPTLDYRAVDAMERHKVTAVELQTFVASGQLKE